MLKLCSFALLVVAAVATTPCEEPAPVPLRVFTKVVKHFTESAKLAGHNCVVDSWTTPTGCLFVTFETDITCDDVPRKLCNDLFRYINKNGWMTGVTGRCEQKCQKMKLILEGKDNPNYDPNVVEVFKPLRSLAEVLESGFKSAELGDYWTKTETFDDDSGIVNIVINIDAKDAECIADEVCGNVLAYLDRPTILDDSTHTCKFVPGCTDKVVLHLLGDY